MAYLTPTDLAEKPGPREMAEVATDPQADVVQTDLMDATLRGLERSAWGDADIAIADNALARISGEISLAQQLMDGFLAKRYPLPLQTVPGMLTVWCRAIVRYQLHGGRISDEKTDPIVRDYRDALKLLQAVQDGSFSLGLDDPLLASPASVDAQFDSTPTIFNRGQLKAFR